MQNKSSSFLKEKWNSKENTFEFQSSGSTGVPKKVIAKRESLERSASRTLSFLNVKNGIILNCLSTLHVGGAMQVIRSLVGNLELHNLTPSSNPFEGENINWSKVSLLSLVPYQLELLLDNYTNELKLCDNILLGGAPLSNSLRDKIKTYQLTNCYETYGMTETFSHIALKNTVSDKLFHCLEGVRITKDSRNCLVLKDELLEIENLSTNDIIELHSEKSFSWKGRYDNVINSGGLKHITELLEQKIAQKITDHRFIIYSLKDDQLGETINLLIESDEEINSLTKKDFYSSVLTKYEIPKTISFIPELSETKTQKILRSDSISRIIEKHRIKID